ncbi:PLP-dependent aminotransferase family protein, partial [Piscinibacter sp.]|uniref:MocR-like pyridoxine biosynthesis transcription factor PdxR n=1 Tax=Piscinibacter sp. TaxID=1903157 RepID=UPI002F42141C
ARPGGGSFVSDVARPASRSVAARRDVAREPRGAIGGRASAPTARDPARDFRLGVPDVSALDWAVWRRLSARALRAFARQPAGYAAAQGQPALREGIAHHVSFARAVSCGSDDVLVTAGAQQAFDLVARTLVKPGRTVVAVEAPGYPPARAAFAAAGATVVPVRVDAEGLVVDELPPQARIVYVTPAHQFPLGCVLSARRRAALIDFACAHRAAIVEDDYDGEFRFDGRPHDALKTIDRSEAVFFVGTFSKSLFPGLRLGYVVPPPWALEALIERKRQADSHCNVPAQDTLAAFIEQGHLARHVRRMRRVYASRRSLLQAALQTPELARWLEPVAGTSGLHLAALARSRRDVDALVADARRASVGVYSLDEYRHGLRAPHGLLFGYGAIGDAAIEDGMQRLRRVLRQR